MNSEENWVGPQCLSQELKKVRHMSHQAEKGETCLTKLRHVYIIGQGSSYDK